MLKKSALVFGVVLVAMGLLGFVGAPITTAADDGMKLLFGLFMVDGTHNVTHLLTGIAALAAAASTSSSKIFFQVFGIVYALIAVLGLVGMDPVLGFLKVNTADNLLHVLIAIAALWLGFGSSERARVEAA